MVRGAIALHAAHEAPWEIIVQDADVDAIARDPHLRKRLDSPPRQLTQHFTLEGRFCLAESSSVGAPEAAVLCVQQELPQQSRPIGRGCGRADLLSMH